MRSDLKQYLPPTEEEELKDISFEEWLEWAMTNHVTPLSSKDED